MRAIKIDSENRTITEIEINGYEDMREAVNGPICRAFTYPDDHHDCYINDEGLLCNPQFFFISKYGYQPYAGNGFIISSDAEGDNSPCTLNLDEVKASIRFLTIDEVRYLIQLGVVDYATYYTPLDSNLEPIEEERTLIARFDLGAFDKKKSK